MAEFSDESQYIHLAIRNGTGQVVTGVWWEVDVLVDSEVIATAVGLNTRPDFLQPGDIGFGYAWFEEYVEIPDGATFLINFDSHVPTADEKPVHQLIQVASIEDGDDELVRTLKNQTNEIFEDLIVVDIYCYEGNEFLRRVEGIVHLEEQFPPGRSLPFTVDLRGRACPSYVVMATGVAEE